MIPRSVDEEHIRENALMNEELKKGDEYLGLEKSEIDRIYKLAKD